MSEVPRDAHLTGVGEPVEDLSSLGPPTPYRPSGPSVSFPAVDALTALHDGGRLDPEGLTDRDPGALRAAGLLTSDGSPTREGKVVAELLARPVARVRIEAAVAGVPLTVESYLRDGRALTLATASPAEVRAGRPKRRADVVRLATTVVLELTDASAVPLSLAAWVGLSPAWSLATGPADLPLSLVTTRVDDPRTPPPPDADAHLREVWRHPWFMWTFGTSPRTTPMVVVDTGPRGQFGLTQGATAGTARFEAIPSGEVWTLLVDAVAQAAAGQRGRRRPPKNPVPGPE